MKLYCEFSKLEITSSEFARFKPSSSRLAHPIFYLNYKDLNSLHNKFIQGKLDTIETILLSLAYMQHSKLVIFSSAIDVRSAAAFCDSKNKKLLSQIRGALYKLPTICEYLHQTTEYNISLFPRVAITPELETEIFSNLSSYIALWEGTIEDCSNNYLRLKQEETRAIQEELISLAINSGKTTSSYISFLTRWLENEIDIEYRYIGLLSSCAGVNSNEAMGIDLESLYDLRDLLYSRLDNSSQYSEAVFSLVRTVIKLQSDNLGIGADFELLSFDVEEESEGGGDGKINPPSNAPSNPVLIPCKEDLMAAAKKKLASLNDNKFSLKVRIL